MIAVEEPLQPLFDDVDDEEFDNDFEEVLNQIAADFVGEEIFPDPVPQGPPLVINWNPSERIIFECWQSQLPKTQDDFKMLELEYRLFKNKSNYASTKTGLCNLRWTCNTHSCPAIALSNRTHKHSDHDFDLRLKVAHSPECLLKSRYEIDRNKILQYLTSKCIHEHMNYQEAYDGLMPIVFRYNKKILRGFDMTYFAKNISVKKRKFYPPVPSNKTHADIDVPARYTTTYNEEPFLLWNHRYNVGGVPGRIMMFGTPNYVANLLGQPRVFVDATFSVVPKPFKQLFTFQAFPCGEKTLVPFVYVLMSHKTKRSYVKLFNWLKTFAMTNNLPINWQYITCDFESGLLPAIRDCLQIDGGLWVDIIGCYFHFCQAIYRKLNEVGLSKAYLSVPALKAFVRRLMALPFVPLEHVQQVYAEIVRPVLHGASALKFAAFLVYFFKNWMDPDTARFPPAIWNVHEVSDDHYTNNNLESWHYQLKKKCLKQYKKLWCVIDVIRHEQELSDVKLLQLFSGINLSHPISRAKKERFDGIRQCHDWLRTNQISVAQHFDNVYQRLWV